MSLTSKVKILILKLSPVIKLLLIISSIFAVSFIIRSHPIILITIILIQTINLCLIIWLLLKSSWFAYILFIIFLGGLIVLFIYITRLASNEKFFIYISPTPIAYFTTIVITILLTNKNEEIQIFNQFNNINKIFSSIYSLNVVTLTTTTIIYLLLTLIVVVKVASKYEGPLRNIVYY